MEAEAGKGSVSERIVALVVDEAHCVLKSLSLLIIKLYQLYMQSVCIHVLFASIHIGVKSFILHMGIWLNSAHYYFQIHHTRCVQLHVHVLYNKVCLSRGCRKS